MNGRHVKVIGHGDPISLVKTKKIEEFLVELVGALGMRTLGPSHVYQEDHGGVSGIVVLSTSHIAIHTWLKKVQEKEYGFFSLDVFSCREFTDHPIKEMLEKYFSVPDVVIKDLSISN